VYAYDLTVNSEEEIESFHLGEAHQEISSVSRSVFDILIESLPHVIPLQRRLRIFAAALAEDQLKHTRQAWAMRLPWEGSDRVRKVRRSHLISDGLEVISSASRDVLRIEFVGTDGTVEAGIDGGGLFKEFMQQWTIGIMDPQFGLFHQLSSGRLVPALDAYRTHADADRLFRAAGRAVGKALYEMVLLETHLGEAFLSRVLSRPFSLDQLQEIDEGLFRNLKFVNETENVEELGLAFSVSTGGIGDMDFDLIPNGSTVPVTSSNKLRYVLLASWYYLSRQLDRPAAAFAAGLSELLPLSRLKIFSPSEINLVISGEQRKGFSVDELRANVVYGGGYSEYSSTVKLLWEVLRED
jgi:ubiquitin-protein ligase E3 C